MYVNRIKTFKKYIKKVTKRSFKKISQINENHRINIR